MDLLEIDMAEGAPCSEQEGVYTLLLAVKGGEGIAKAVLRMDDAEESA